MIFKFCNHILVVKNGINLLKHSNINQIEVQFVLMIWSLLFIINAKQPTNIKGLFNIALLEGLQP